MLVSSREGLPELYVTLHAQPVGSGTRRWSKTEDAGRIRSLQPRLCVCVCARAPVRPCVRACVRACVIR